MRHVLIVLLACASLSAGSVIAREDAAPPPIAPLEAAPGATAPVSEVPLVVPPGAQAGPDFDVERATQAYIETLSPEKRERSDAYFEGGYWLSLWSFLYGLATAWIFLGLRVSAWMRDFAEKRTGNATLQTMIYGLLHVPVGTLLGLPLAWYAGFFREHQYGMATQTLLEWAGDQGKGLLVGMILGTLFIAALYAVFRKTGRQWWVFGTLTAVAFVVFAALIAPLYIDPLFNDYKSLPPGPTRDRILSIAHATGVPAHDVVWFDASRQTKRISANVAGIGGTMRIALNDNLLARSPPESIEAVMGHELGHYTLNHVYEGIIYFGLIFLVGFWAVAATYDRVVARWGSGWGLRPGVTDVAGLPLLGALFSVYMFVATPVINSVIRGNEAEADRYGIATSGQADGFAFVAMQLSEYRKISPGYWEEILFYDHPSGYARVRAAMEWKAEHGGLTAAPETAAP
jgi:STE24 endopeptidase